VCRPPQLEEGRVFSHFVKGYTGANEFKPCSEYAKRLFMDQSTKKNIYTHITTAIDTSNVKFVFNAVVAMILESNLKSAGLS